MSLVFSRGHATLELAMSVDRSVGQLVRRSVTSHFCFPLLPTRPRLKGSVYGLVNPLLLESMNFREAKILFFLRLLIKLIVTDFLDF